MKHLLQAEIIRIAQGDEFASGALIEFQFLLPIAIILLRVHPPILDIKIEFPEVEIGSECRIFDNSVSHIIFVSDIMRCEPIGDAFLPLRLHGDAVLRPEPFRRFDLILEIIIPEQALLEAPPAIGFAVFRESFGALFLGNRFFATVTPVSMQ